MYISSPSLVEDSIIVIVSIDSSVFSLFSLFVFSCASPPSPLALASGIAVHDASLAFRLSVLAVSHLAFPSYHSMACTTSSLAAAI